MGHTHEGAKYRWEYVRVGDFSALSPRHTRQVLSTWLHRHRQLDFQEAVFFPFNFRSARSLTATLCGCL